MAWEVPRTASLPVDASEEPSVDEFVVGVVVNAVWAFGGGEMDDGVRWRVRIDEAAVVSISVYTRCYGNVRIL